MNNLRDTWYITIKIGEYGTELNLPVNHYYKMPLNEQCTLCGKNIFEIAKMPEEKFYKMYHMSICEQCRLILGRLQSIENLKINGIDFFTGDDVE